MDNFIVSARKYRPATFATVVGQSAITNTLKNAIRNQQIAQAFLFTGPRGVGKTTCARILAKTINCSNISDDGEACNVCPSCVSFNKSTSFNIFELDAASNNTVEDIRNLVDQVRIPPQHGYKVYIVDEVHMLSQSAFNAFLKTLEEPPSYAKFILATTEKHKILPTILSRCQIFDFRRISVDDIAQHLQFVADSEHIVAEPEALHIIAQKADGGLRDALSMFDQLVSYSGNNLTYKQVIENLNVLDYEYYFKITDYVLNGDISNTLLTINEIIENGFEGQHFITGLGQHLRNLLVSKDTITLQLLETSNSVKNEYYKQSQKSGLQFLLQALEITNECDINYKTSNNKKLHVEIALMQLCKLSGNITDKFPTPPVAPVKDNSKSKESQSPAKSTETNPSTNKATLTDTPPSLKEPIEKTEKKSEQNPIETSSPKPKQSASSVPLPSLTGINISHLMTGSIGENKKSNTEIEEEQPVESFGNEHVSISEVLSVWNRLADEFEANLPLLHSTLLWKEPQLLDNDVISISIENSLQQDEIFKNKNEITLFLRRELKNDNISVTWTVVESTPEDRRPYTDTEKYEYLANKAPAVRDLRDQLGLDLEM
jgi:DNA polymerase-3 subunit gamma/tau